MGNLFDAEPGAPLSRRLALTHWRVFNFMVRRVMALGFVFVGLILLAYDLPMLLPGGTINVNGVPSSDMVYRLFGTPMPLVACVVGVALYRTKPYLPSWHTAAALPPKKNERV